jgi:hypothetical protein
MKSNKELLPREKPTTEEMLLAPKGGIHHDINLRNREKQGKRAQTLTRPDLPDGSLP